MTQWLLRRTRLETGKPVDPQPGRVNRSKAHLADAGDDDGTETHGTGGKRGVKNAVACAVLLRRERGECLQLRVREQAPGLARETLVAAFGDDGAGGVGQHRADRDAPVAVRLPGHLDRGAPRRFERAP
jgi:hypothetical protein